MPAKSPAQERLMQAAAHTPGGYGGVPQSVGKEFVSHDSLNEKEREEANKSNAEREDMPADVFLEPGERKYPVKSKQDGEWKYSRDLLLAAEKEANMHGHKELAERAKSIRTREFDAKADSASIPCAGVLFKSGNKFLLLHRTDRNEWEGPGGHIDGDETPLQCALRESSEEIGAYPSSDVLFARESRAGDISYSQYVSNVSEFTPTLNHEHDAFGWFSVDNLPEGTHPETVNTIYLLSGNELDTAQMIRAGELSSPQRYENIWLFDVRVTGTGLSFRDSLGEYVYRAPDEFLTEEFVERCNGLPVVFEHPDGNILDSEEYRNRSVGNVILPYLTDKEVRGIAKIYDEDAADLMRSSHISTSPTVVFRDAGSTESVQLDNGKTLLIEGEPSYLDHLAICQVGVWDKGGEPTGVTNGESPMADAKKDEEAVPAYADAIMKRLDSLEAQMNSKADSELEKAKEAGAEEEKAEKEALEAGKKESEAEAKADESEEEAKKHEAEGGKKANEEERGERMEKEKEAKADEDDKKATEEKADAARENLELKARLASMESMLRNVTRETSAQDRDLLAAAQARADSVARMFGDAASPPLAGENPIAYRKRLAEKFKRHCSKFSDVKLDSLDGVLFEEVEKAIYADAQAAALNPETVEAGALIPMSESFGGRTITRYHGDPMSWMQHFMRGPAIAKINRPSNGIKGVH